MEVNFIISMAIFIKILSKIHRGEEVLRNKWGSIRALNTVRSGPNPNDPRYRTVHTVQS
jgi:hypothetical protein